jgi:hypothetical protein
MTEDRFDGLLQEMRDESVPPGEMAAARERVWARLAEAAPAACTEFRRDFDSYREGGLGEARRLLLEDHLTRCAECRRMMADLPVAATSTDARKVPAMPALQRSRFTGWTRWAVAAGVALIGLYAGRGAIDTALAPGGPRAKVVAVSGQLYGIENGSLEAGATLDEAQVVRTTAGSRAIIELIDGSRVEMNQRTSVSVRAAWSGQTVWLDRGDVIVEAAKQRRGRLRVETRDSVAAVKGTVFAVSAGTAGSLVTVVEGAVQVSQPGTNRVLTPGENAATNRALASLGAREAVAWSQDAEKYFSLLAELTKIEKEIAAMPGPAMRTEARLLRYLPAGTRVYFAIPNVSGTLRQAMSLIEQRVRDNPALDEWWNSSQSQELRKTLDHIQAVTPLLGEEVVFVMAGEAPGSKREYPLMMAEIQAGRHDALRQALDRIAAEKDGPVPYTIAKDLLLVSGDAAELAAMQARLGSGSGSAFASEIARHYQGGVGWLIGLDITAFGDALQGEQAPALGMGNMRYLFFEQRSPGGRDMNEATLSFQGARTGIASWLAAPGATGATDYISQDAVIAFAASARNPRQAFDELLAMVGQGDLAAEIREFESETGVSVANDIASSLGTDFAVAIERPSLPVPGWVAAFEVLRPSAWDDAVQRMAEAFNRKLSPEDAARRVTMSKETVNGRVWMSLSSAGGALTIHWTHDRGYMVASMDRALALRAISVRETGASLVRSPRFQDRFPAASSMHHSGFVWLNTNGLLADLAGLVQSPVVKNLMGSRDPLLVVMNGETERIHAASRTRLTSLLLDLMIAGGAAHQLEGSGPHTQPKALRELRVK